MPAYSVANLGEHASDGYTGCQRGFHQRPAASNLRFTGFPSNYANLPDVSFVVPNICNDMHDCSVSTGDTWLKNNLDAYAQWAKAYNSLLVVTFDEDDSSQNQIPTIFGGQHVRPGNYSEHVDHYRVLRTLEDAKGLPYAGNSASTTPITDAW